MKEFDAFTDVFLVNHSGIFRGLWDISYGFRDVIYPAFMCLLTGILYGTFCGRGRDPQRSLLYVYGFSLTSNSIGGEGVSSK